MGGGSQETTSETNPWANMPDWQEDYFKKGAEFSSGLWDRGTAVADDLAANPREIFGMSEGEAAGLDSILQGGADARDKFDESQGMLEGFEDYNSDFGNYEDLQARASGNLTGGYEDRYVDDVVDTTLAGMDRNAQREALARESRNAATGGTSNSRTAVGNAIAGQLSGMNRAEMEAKLRQDAQQFGTDANFKETELLRGLAGDEMAKLGQGFEEGQYNDGTQFNILDRIRQGGLDEWNLGMGEGQAMSSFGETERGLNQQALDEARTADQQSTSWLANLFSGSQGNSGPTGGVQTNTTPGPSTFSQILGAGTAVGGMFMGSDENMKHDIAPMEHGLNALKDVTPATYEYNDDAPVTVEKKGRTAGLMAQDLEHIPGAVTMATNGYRYVDPYPVLATVVQAVKELDRRTGAN